jgi:hypothetical protein
LQAFSREGLAGPGSSLARPLLPLGGMGRLLEFRMNPQEPRREERLAAVLNEQFHQEKLHGRRRSFINIVAVASLPLALFGALPSSMDRGVVRAIQIVWAGALLGACVWGAAEWRSHRRLRRLTMLAGPVRVTVTEETRG